MPRMAETIANCGYCTTHCAVLREEFAFCTVKAGACVLHPPGRDAACCVPTNPYLFRRAQQALAPCTRSRWALPPAPPLGPILYLPLPLSADVVGACAPRPAAGERCPRHPRWGHFLVRTTTVFHGLCRRLRPAPAAGGRRPLHPRWGHFISPDPLKLRLFAVPNSALSCLHLATAVRR
jgi:hypothetical protein